MITSHYEHSTGVSLQLTRHRQTAVATFGTLVVFNEQHQIILICRTLEKPWLNNIKSLSCVPNGKYYATKEIHPKFGPTVRIHKVIDRTGILIHRGNFYWNTSGCVLVGTHLVDLNFDKEQDVANSRAAMQDLYDSLSNTFTIEFLGSQTGSI